MTWLRLLTPSLPCAPLEKAINGPTDMCEAARQEFLTNLTAPQWPTAGLILTFYICFFLKIAVHYLAAKIFLFPKGRGELFSVPGWGV